MCPLITLALLILYHSHVNILFSLGSVPITLTSHPMNPSDRWRERGDRLPPPHLTISQGDVATCSMQWLGDRLWRRTILVMVKWRTMLIRRAWKDRGDEANSRCMHEKWRKMGREGCRDLLAIELWWLKDLILMDIPSWGWCQRHANNVCDPCRGCAVNPRTTLNWRIDSVIAWNKV